MFIDFRERGREGERKRVKHRCERETSIGHLQYVPPPESNPQYFCVWAHAPTSLSHRPGLLLFLLTVSLPSVLTFFSGYPLCRYIRDRPCESPFLFAHWSQLLLSMSGKVAARTPAQQSHGDGSPYASLGQHLPYPCSNPAEEFGLHWLGDVPALGPTTITRVMKQHGL